MLVVAALVVFVSTTMFASSDTSASMPERTMLLRAGREADGTGATPSPELVAAQAKLRADVAALSMPGAAPPPAAAAQPFAAPSATSPLAAPPTARAKEALGDIPGGGAAAAGIPPAAPAAGTPAPPIAPPLVAPPVAQAVAPQSAAPAAAPVATPVAAAQGSHPPAVFSWPVTQEDRKAWMMLPPDPSRKLSTDIDIVYMYANGSDPEHARLRKAAGGPEKAGSRDRDSNELLYSLRSVHKNMGSWFGGKIHILTDTVPTWLNTSHPQVVVNLHKDVFPNPATEAPSFNSDAIMSVLTRVPDLPKYFIKMDDDNLIGLPTTPDDFVEVETGKPRLYYEKNQYAGPVTGAEDAVHIEKHKKAGRTWTAKMYHSHQAFTQKMPECQDPNSGVTPKTFRYCKHAPVVFETALLNEVYEKWAPEFEASRKMKFRGADGYDVHAMYSWYCSIRNRCSEWSQEYTDANAKLIYINDQTDKKIAKTFIAIVRLMANPPVFFTFNDEISKPWSETTDLSYNVVLPKFFPDPSPWEKVGYVP